MRDARRTEGGTFDDDEEDEEEEDEEEEEEEEDDDDDESVISRPANANVPPSPWLSAIKIKMMYLKHTTSRISQTSRLRAPTASSWEGSLKSPFESVKMEE